MGRVGVDLYPLQDNVGLEDVETFSKSVGGSAGNVAIAAAKHGRRAALISRTGPDAFGRFVHQALRRDECRRSVHHRRARPADPGDVLRDVPAGPFPVAVLPVADRAGPGDPPGGARPGRDRRRATSSGRR